MRSPVLVVLIVSLILGYLLVRPIVEGWPGMLREVAIVIAGLLVLWAGAWLVMAA